MTVFRFAKRCFSYQLLSSCVPFVSISYNSHNLPFTVSIQAIASCSSPLGVIPAHCINTYTYMYTYIFYAKTSFLVRPFILPSCAFFFVQIRS